MARGLTQTVFVAAIIGVVGAVVGGLTITRDLTQRADRSIQSARGEVSHAVPPGRLG